MKALFLGTLAASQAMPIIEFITADIRSSPLRERLNKGLAQEMSGMAICAPATLRVIGPFLCRIRASARFAGWLRTHYAWWQRSRCRRAMNRLASAQVTSRRWVFFFSPR